MKHFSAPQKQKKNAARGIIIQSIQGAGRARAPTGDVRRASSDGEHGAANIKLGAGQPASR